MVNTILVLEDEPELVNVLRLILLGKGYLVLTASHARAALSVAWSGHIDLLIADVTPPCWGIHVALQLKASIPTLRIILTSGYPIDMWDEQQSAELSEIPSDSVRLLQKPFLPTILLEAVEELIGPSPDQMKASV